MAQVLRRATALFFFLRCPLPHPPLQLLAGLPAQLAQPLAHIGISLCALPLKHGQRGLRGAGQGGGWGCGVP